MLMQGVASRQLPGVQAPFRQTWPVPHCGSVVQATQAFPVQTLPSLQPALLWQVPGMQAPPSQTRACG